MATLNYRLAVDATNLDEFSREALDTLSFDLMQTIDKTIRERLVEHDVIPERLSVSDITDLDDEYEIADYDECDCDEDDMPYECLEKVIQTFNVDDIVEELEEKDGVETQYWCSDTGHVEVFTIMVQHEEEEDI